MDSSLTRRSLPCAHGKLPRPDAKGLSVVIPTEVACRVFFIFSSSSTLWWLLWLFLSIWLTLLFSILLLHLHIFSPNGLQFLARRHSMQGPPGTAADQSSSDGGRWMARQVGFLTCASTFLFLFLSSFYLFVFHIFSIIFNKSCIYSSFVSLKGGPAKT